MREYKTIRTLNSGEVIDLDGLRLRKRSGDLGPGDLYVAERNADPVLLTCARVHPEGIVFPTTVDYPYDLHECVRVEEST